MRGSSPWTTCWGRARRSSPPPCARCSRWRRSMGASSRPRAEDDGGRRSVQPLAGAGAGDVGSIMDLDLTDEQRLIPETARDFADNEIVPRARENDRAARFDRELASRMGDMGYLGAPVAEEYGGREPRLPDLRTDRRGGRSRRLLGSHRGLGPDLPRVRLDRALGHGGAEATLASAPVLRRGARLLRAHRARRRIGPVRRCAPGRSSSTASWHDQRAEDVDLARQLRRGRAPLRTDRPREAPPRHRLLPRAHRDRGLLRPGDPRQARAAGLRHGVAGLRRGRDPRGRTAGRGRRRVQDRDDGARLRALLGRGRVRRDLRGMRPGVDQVRERAPSSSASRSPASSSSRR